MGKTKMKKADKSDASVEKRVKRLEDRVRALEDAKHVHAASGKVMTDEDFQKLADEEEKLHEADEAEYDANVKPGPPPKPSDSARSVRPVSPRS